MSTSGISARGTTIKVSGTTIALVYSLGGPSVSKEAPEITDLSDSYRHFSGSGMRDGGEITLGLRYLPSNTTHDSVTGLMWHLSNDVVASCVVTWPDAETFKFSGVVTAIAPAAELPDALDASVTMKVTGIPTFS